MIDPASPDFADTPVAPHRPNFGYAPHDAAAPPVVSVVTPFFNTGDVFHDTAQSLFRQSLQQWEWLIVNDGSTDRVALAVLDSYRRRDPRLRVIDLPANVGSSAARNIGVTGARSELVAHLDSDDLIEPTTLEKWLWFLTSYPEYGAVTSYIVHFGSRERLRLNGCEVGKGILADNLLGMRCMVRRAVHQAAGGFNEDNRQGLIDWEYWLRIACAGYWGGTVPELLPWYRRRKGHGQQWANWLPAGRKSFEQRIRRDYAPLWQKDGFPRVALRPHAPYAPVPDTLPFANTLRSAGQSLLVICDDWLDLGAIASGQWAAGVTIASTTPQSNSWLASVSRLSPDVFILPNIVRLTDQPRVLRYLIASRRPGALALHGSLLGHLLVPYLRAHFPTLPVADVRPGEYNGIAGAALRESAPDVQTGRIVATQAVEYMRLAGAATERKQR